MTERLKKKNRSTSGCKGNMAGGDKLSEPNVVLKIGDNLFPCRREILSQCSPYFQAMFGHNFIEKDQNIIEIKNVEPDAMKILVEFSKTNDLPRNTLHSQNVLSLLQASSMLQFERVQKVCLNVIVNDWLSIETCLQTMTTAHVLDLLSLYRKARSLALWEFSTVKTTSAFFELSVDALVDYLGNDGLNTKQGEFEVFDAGLSWLQEDSDNRKEYLLRVLECVRFSDMSSSDIRTMFLYPNVTEDNEALEILHYVLKIKEGNIQCNVNTNNGSDSSQIEDVEINQEDGDNETSKANAEDNSARKPSVGLDCFGCGNEGSEQRWESDSSQSSVSDTHTCAKVCCCVVNGGHKVSYQYRKKHKADSSSESKRSSSSNQSKNQKEDDPELVKVALQLLSRQPRQLPFVPCVIGHKTDLPSKERHSTRPKSCIIYFDEKLKEPVPFMSLTKVNDGPMEPTGYKIVNRGQDLFITGGEYLLGYGQWNYTVWKYNIWQDKWSIETSLPDPRRHHSVCVLDDDIYIIGGFGRHRVIMGTVERYNLVSKTWMRRASLPSTMYSAACCVHKGRIFVFGVENCIYQVKENAWYTFPRPLIPGKITFSCAMSHGDCIYLVGAYTPELLRFSPDQLPQQEEVQECYQQLGSFKYLTASACLANNKIYSFSANDQGLINIEMYDICSEEFQVLWTGSDRQTGGISDFNPRNCIGCFPLVMY